MIARYDNLAVASHVYLRAWQTDFCGDGRRCISVMVAWGEREVIWEDVFFHPADEEEAWHYACAVVTVLAGQIEQHQQRKRAT